MAGFNINDLLNAKSKGAAVQAEAGRTGTGI